MIESKPLSKMVQLKISGWGNKMQKKRGFIAAAAVERAEVSALLHTVASLFSLYADSDTGEVIGI